MELKIISLSEEELRTALTRHLMRGLEKGREFYIDEMILNEKQPISVKLTLQRGSGRSETILFDHSFLAAAILRFCMDNNIPLPRRATKNLEIHNGLISIVLNMETKDPR